MSAIVKKPADAGEALESLIVNGNLAVLNPQQRVEYYKHICAEVGLNWVTRPFDYLILNNKLTLYANRGCTDQLRAKRNISLRPTSRRVEADICIVEVEATQGDRVDFATGAVFVGAMKGEALANAMMKAETKAKRRATLSICGLGMMDESEIETVPGAQPVKAEMVEPPAKPVRAAKRLAPGPEPAPAPGVDPNDDGLGGFDEREPAQEPAAAEPAPPEPAPPPKPAPAGRPFMEEIKAEHARIGDVAYGAVLDQFGYVSAIEIKDTAKQRAILKALFSRPSLNAAPEPAGEVFDSPQTATARLNQRIRRQV